MAYSIRIIYALLVTVLAAGIFIACTESGADTKAAGTMNKKELIKRGEYLVTIMGCADCHSPKVFGHNGPEPDMERYLSGHPQEETLNKIDPNINNNWALMSMDGTSVVGPWGVSFSANLTPDETGIGAWTEEQFANAFQKGMYKGIKGTRMLLPPMPWPAYSKVKEEDVKAIFYYLKSLKPVRNIVPSAISPNQLATMK
jgi:mono/diheme cytochrome c family protein